jgi:DNA-binding NtrC family response regulator
VSGKKDRRLLYLDILRLQRFHFNFIFSSSSFCYADDSEKEKSTKEQKGGEMKTILVVDDEARMRKIYKTLLAIEGYRVVEAPGAVEANEILKTEPVHLVLLDLRMPEINGNILYDVMQLFHKKTKVIVSSVYHIEKQKKIIPEAADYYDKSQGIEMLLKKIRTLLKDQEFYEDVRLMGSYENILHDEMGLYS